MKVLVKFLLKVLEIGIAIGTYFGFKRAFDSAPPGLELIASILIFVVMQVLEGMFEAHFSDKALEGRFDALQLELRSLAESLALQTGERALIQIGLAHAGCRLNEEEISRVWNRLTWAVTESYRATNYIDMPYLYRTGFAENTVSVQKAKLLDKITMKKVFIVDALPELNVGDAKAIISAHGDIPIRVILREKLDTVGVLSQHLRNVGGDFDFAIFDGRVILVWQLNAHRKIVGGKVLMGNDLVTKFIHFFDALSEEGKPLSEVLTAASGVAAVG
jgi:hypothetical protein